MFKDEDEIILALNVQCFSHNFHSFLKKMQKILPYVFEYRLHAENLKLKEENAKLKETASDNG